MIGSIIIGNPNLIPNNEIKTPIDIKISLLV